MQRRLYFLLPDAEHARAVTREVLTNGVSAIRVHAIGGPGIDMQGLPLATGRQRNDPCARLETLLWDGNLVIFLIAVLAIVLMLSLQVAWYWLLLPAAIVLITFLLGEEFTRRLPAVHLSEFRDALHHGEIVLMIDVAAADVARIEALVHRRHPEAVTGGVCWNIDTLHA